VKRSFCLSFCLLVGCTTTTLETRRIPLGEHRERVPRDPSLPRLTADWVFGDGMLRGVVHSPAACQAVDVELIREEDVSVTTPNSMSVTGVAGGLLLGIGPFFIFGQASSSSYSETCDATGCTSESEQTDYLGGVSLVLGLAVAAYSVYQVLQGPQTEVLATRMVRQEVRRLPEDQPCWDGPPLGLELALVQAGRELARAAIDGAGLVAFSVPEDTRGELEIVVHSVPPALAQQVPVGAPVGRFQRSP